MAKRSLVSDWISEFCAPVVAVVATAEVEAISLKNGLLFHDLLRAFNKIDTVTSIRSCSQVVQLNEAHIRFERSTELMAKSSGTVEELLRSQFEEFDLAKLPANVSELKSATPSSWSRHIEQIVARSMSFSEFELLSHPIILLTVIATTDFDTVACMQEMASYHHTPQCLSTGQYEADVQRVFLLIHDPFTAPNVDPMGLLRKLHAKFPPVQTRLLIINSVPPDSPNLLQPDLWAPVISPLYFPQHAPVAGGSLGAGVTSPSSHYTAPIHGAHLNLNDFINIRNFCQNLYQQDIIPVLERRISNLTRIVNEARKGVKNVLKSFWRKPRDELPAASSGLRYRVERIEAQILLLADTCFIAKDYESAQSMYKMVKEDFKADKSMVHIAHTCLMGILCHIMLDPSRRELRLQLDSLIQVLATVTEPTHAHAFFAILAADMYYQFMPVRSPVEAAQTLLTAAAVVAKLDLLSGLLVERAASMYMLAGMTRKFLFYEVLCGLKMRSCGTKPSLHSIVNTSCALLLQDETKWGGLKAKLSMLVAGDIKSCIPYSEPQYIILVLKALCAAVADQGYVTGTSTNIDTVAGVVLKDLAASASKFGALAVSEGWDQSSTFETIQNPYYVYDKESERGSVNGAIATSKRFLEVTNLCLPEVDVKRICLLQPLNGLRSRVAFGITTKEWLTAEKFSRLLATERSWGIACELSASISTPYDMSNLWTKLVEIEFEEELSYRPEGGGASGLVPGKSLEIAGPLKIPLGELLSVQVHMRNPLTSPLNLDSLCLEMPAGLETIAVSVVVPPKSDIDVVLEAFPLKLGSFIVDTVNWVLPDGGINVVKQVHKPGRLLHKTLTQRATRSRTNDTSLQFEVIAPYPLLQISVEGITEDILQGQLIQTFFTFTNEGAAPAAHIFFKINKPGFVFYFSELSYSNQAGSQSADLRHLSTSSSSAFIPPWGQSSSVTRLPLSVIIPPGEKYSIGAWVRLGGAGPQTISVVASYLSIDLAGNTYGFGNRGNSDPRTSFYSINTNICHSVSMRATVVAQSSSLTRQSLIVDVVNKMAPKKKDRHSQSTMGMIDLQLALSEDGNIEEGRCRIEGLAVFGAARPVVKPEFSDENAARESQPTASFAENATVIYPLDIQVENNFSSSNRLCQQATDRTHILSKAWALPLPQHNSQHTETLSAVVERMLCQNMAVERSDGQVNEAFKKTLAAEEANVGPKSIAQVRKEREKMFSSRQSDETVSGLKSNYESNNALPSLVEVDLNSQAFVQSADDSSTGPENRTSTSEKADQHATILNHLDTSLSCLGVPVSIMDFVEGLNKRRKIAVIVLWSCRWHGKIRTGLHFIRDISPNHVQRLLIQPSITPRKASKPISSEDISNLLVCINHVTKSRVQPASQCAFVKVRMELWNTHNMTLYVNVEPIDCVWNTPLQTSCNDIVANIIASPSFKLPISIPETQASHNPSNLALTWVGKVRYVGIELVPSGRSVVVFQAKISVPGVYDLHRFKVLVGSTGSGEETDMLLKQWKGSSFIEVI